MRLPIRTFALISCAFLSLATLLVPDAHGAPLRLTAPNGGERFRVGAPVIIRWDGVAPTDTVTLEYSTDNGATWNLITSTATGLQHAWSNVPNTPSTRCLMRASTKATVGDSVLYLESFEPGDFLPDAVHWAEFSPDGARVIGGGAEGKLYIWDSFTAALIGTIPVEDRANIPSPPGITLISSARYSPDGSLIAIISPLANRTGSRVRIFNAATRAKVREWVQDEGRNFPSSADCAFSPDGTRLAVTGTGGGQVYNVADGSLVSQLKGYTATVPTGTVIASMVDADWRPDGTAIIGAVLDGSGAVPNLILSDPLTGNVIRTYDLGTNDALQSVRFSPDGNRMIVTVYDGSAFIVDAASGSIVHDIRDYEQYPNFGGYSNDGNFFATVGQDVQMPNWKLRLYDAAGGGFLRTVGAIVNGMQNLDFSPDGARILVACVDGVRIFQSPVSTAGQSDVSDGQWEIYSEPGTVIVRLPVVTARQGETVEIPVVIDDPGAALGAGATRIDLELRYNVSLLDPLAPTPRGTFDDAQRTLTLSFPLASATDTILGMLRFRAALGNDSTTALDLANTRADAAAVTVFEGDGLFRLADLCREGGARLLNPNGAVALKVVRTMPDAIEAEIETIEDGPTTLTLTDLAGRRVREYIRGDRSPGRSLVRFDLDGVSSGGYFLLLRTPTVVKSVRVEVAR